MKTKALYRESGKFILKFMLKIEPSNKMDDSPIELDRINHGFDGKIVLTDFSFSFNTNTITAILGRSGSGKSTLLQIINCTIIPDKGHVLLFGKKPDYVNINAIRLQLGYVVQQVGLFPHMNIKSNINLLGRITRQMKAANQNRVDQLLDMVQLPATCQHKYPHELSGGEQQRVGLCRAMFLNPPVLLMDEPFASLDYETKRSIYKHIQDIQQNEPRTIILVTHDWEEAALLADQFIWIEDGRIKDAGDQRYLVELKKRLFSTL